jgi:N-acetylglucosaminyldiphosphoundecaprenol N-acetyl-beta-D-mannosaminyltransferase
MTETAELAGAATRTRQRVQYAALNVAKFPNMRFDPVLATDIASSDIVGIDSMGVVRAARAIGLPIEARLSGVDLLTELLADHEGGGFQTWCRSPNDVTSMSSIRAAFGGTYRCARDAAIQRCGAASRSKAAK